MLFFYPRSPRTPKRYRKVILGCAGNAAIATAAGLSFRKAAYDQYTGAVVTEPFSYRVQPAKNVVGLRFTHDGGLIVASDPELCAWRVPSLERAYRVRPLVMQLQAVVVQSHCARIVCGGWRSEFAVLDSDTGETLAHYAERPERPVALSACGRFGIYILRHGWCVRDIETNERTWERETPGTIVSGISPIDAGRRWALHIHVLPDTGANASRSRVEIWSWPFGSGPERVVGDALLAIDSVAVHRDGAIAICGVPERGRKTLRVYGEGEAPLAEDAAELMTRLVGWAGAGHFASALDDRIEIRSVATAKIVSTIEAPGSKRYAVCLGPGGTDLAIAYPQGFVYARGGFANHDRLRIENPWPSGVITGKRITAGPDVRYSRPAPAATRTITASTMAELKAALADLAQPTWTPVLHMDEGPTTASKLGGTPSLAPGTDWPRCGICEDFLQPLLQLNASDLPAELQGLFVGTLQAFFCTTPDCAAWDPFARVALARLATLSATAAFTQPPFPEAFIGRRIVAWERHLDYPAEEELQELGVVLANGPEMDGEFLSPLGRDKLMGWPAWPHGPSYAKCPKCAGRMRVIVQIGSEQCVPHMFGDGYPAYISQCERHRDVLAFHFGT
jgi:hypothetical protein